VRWLILLSFISFAACKKNTNAPAKVEDFSNAYSIKTQFNAKDSLLTVDIELKEGFHAYGQGEKIAKPLKLEIIKENGWEAIGEASLPSGHKKDLGSLGESVVLEGKFVIKQKLKTGTEEGRALLHLQLCSDILCDRPRSYELRLKSAP
jgi:hypothetical protein